MRNLRSFTIALGCATALTVACGAKTSGGVGGDGGGGASSAATACNDYFQALLTSCPSDGFVAPTEPASVIDHVQSRWTALCEQLVVLPGTSVTADALEACVPPNQTIRSWLLQTAARACALAP